MIKLRIISRVMFFTLTLVGILTKSIGLMYVGLIFKLYADYQTRLMLEKELLQYKLDKYFKED